MKLKYGRTLLVGLAFMSICAFWQIYDNIVPLILKNTFQLNATFTGLIMGADNVLALFMLPLFGALSDKANSKIGRRMPFILAGTFVAAACTILLPIADKNANLVLFMVSLGVVLIAMSVYRSPAVALMPDVTPKPLRSKGNAIINLTGAVGGALVLVATPLLVEKADRPSYIPIFTALAIFMIVSVLILFISVNEPKSVAEMRRQSAEAGIDETSVEDEATGQSIKMEPAVKKSFLFILLSIFLWFMGYNAVTSTFTRYAEEMWGIGVRDSALILLVANVAAIISYLPVGFLATRYGRKKTILGGIIMLALAFGSAFAFRSFSMLIFGCFALAGVGWAFINVNSYPMVVDMSKGPNIGKYTGYYYLSSMLAQSITPFISGIFIDLYGYRTLLPYGCIFVVLAFVSMLSVNHGDSRPVPRNSTLEAFDVDD